MLKNKKNFVIMLVFLIVLMPICYSLPHLYISAQSSEIVGEERGTTEIKISTTMPDTCEIVVPIDECNKYDVYNYKEIERIQENYESFTEDSKKERISYLICALGSDDGMISFYAIEAIGDIVSKLDSNDPMIDKIVNSLLTNLHNADKGYLRHVVSDLEHAVSNLGIVGSKINPSNSNMNLIIDALLTIIKDPGKEGKLRGEHALGEIGSRLGPDDPRVDTIIDTLMARINDPDYLIKSGAASALGEIGSRLDPDDPRRDIIIDVLMVGLQDKNQNVRGWRMSDLNNIASVLNTPTNKQSFALKISDSLNDYFSGFDDPTSTAPNQYSVLINGLHDAENNPQDVIRRTIVENLNLDSIYYLMSIGGSDMYTSTFLTFYYTNFKDGRDTDNYKFGMPRYPNFLNDIKPIDPNNDYMAGFILTLANFDRLKEIINNDPEFIISAIENVLFKEDNNKLREAVPKLISTIEWLLSKGNKARTESFLLNKYDEYKISFIEELIDRILNQDEKKIKLALFVYLLKSNCELNEDGHAETCNKFTNSNKVLEIVNSPDYPPVLKPKVNKNWLNDNTLTAKLYFTQEGQIGRTKNNYINRFEFIEVDNPSGEGYVLEPKLDVNEYGYSGGLVNGIKFRLILTEEIEDVQQSIDSYDIDIIAHRGHSFSELNVFSSSIISDNNKLIYLGGCGGFGRVPIIQRTLPNMYYFSDSDTGYGDDNDRILFYALRAMAQLKDEEKITWRMIEEKIEQAYNDYRSMHPNTQIKYPSGIIYPDHKGLLLNPFINQFTLS